LRSWQRPLGATARLQRLAGDQPSLWRAYAGRRPRALERLGAKPETALQRLAGRRHYQRPRAATANAPEATPSPSFVQRCAGVPPVHLRDGAGQLPEREKVAVKRQHLAVQYKGLQKTRVNPYNRVNP